MTSERMRGCEDGRGGGDEEGKRGGGGGGDPPSQRAPAAGDTETGRYKTLTQKKRYFSLSE